jgi:uncharacterized metal-binding protein
MRVVVRPLPVIYACQGCPEFGQLARDAGLMLDAAGVGQTVWLGAGRPAPLNERYPIFALEGCEKRCAQGWLERHGVVPDRTYVVGRA